MLLKGWTSVILSGAIWCITSAEIIPYKQSQSFFGVLGNGPCPESCDISGNNPNNWTLYHDIDRLLACKERPKLLDFAIHTSLKDPETRSIIRACQTFRGELAKKQVDEARYQLISGNDKFHSQILSLGAEATIDFELAWSKSDERVIPGQVITGAKEIQAVLLNETERASASDRDTFVVAHYGSSTVGVYVGRGVRDRGFGLTAVQLFIERVQNHDTTISKTLVLQACGKSIDSDYTMGIIADTSRGIESLFIIQQALKSWSKANCVTGLDGSVKLPSSPVWLANTSSVPAAFSLKHAAVKTRSPATTSSHQYRKPKRHLFLAPRADCQTVQVASGDSCGSLATKCKISGNDIMKYNPAKEFCSSLRPGQYVCCSSGTLPDLRPKPHPDGSCASYTVKSGDWCDKIASPNGLTSNDIENFNKKTWGWSGCSLLFPGANICLSSGDPPMPAPIANAVCGPQKPGTNKPAKGTKLANLNPCPLNACCNIWGQCGITQDFCIDSSLGPPGTSKPGKNGCISNCGTDIVNNGRAPSTHFSVGYFEAWNFDRACLRMDVTDIGRSITHVHFAFGSVDKTFTVSTSQVQTQFENFKTLKGKKRILAFGGWTASTDPSSYWIFREGVKSGNRETLATNMANFIKSHNLDGIDLDWEYPGAPDIPGIPPAEPLNGPDYLEFLKLLRQKLPGKSLSIAAPASYWYLKAFPIDKISEVVDYIVYMTYDLHGQWDYGNSYSNPSCPEGNCLRSHVNVTETITALSMITKAGVSTSKIVVGVSSYGRSFRMTEKGCTGPLCRFVGIQSGAAPGRCTQTAGYISNAEIQEILKDNKGAKTFKDDSGSNILVYDEIQWVAYMDDENKASRSNRWNSLNFLGTTDWAVDLQAFTRYDPPKDAPPLDPKKKWRDLDCRNWAVKAPKLFETRWYALRTDDAWNDIVNAWKGRAEKTTKDSFPRFVSKFVHGQDKFDCNVISSINGCAEISLCLQGDETGPAAYFILNSMQGIYTMHEALHTAITDAYNPIANKAEGFIKIFGPKTKSQLLQQILLNVLNLAFGALIAPIFNTGFLRGGSLGQLTDAAANAKDAALLFASFAVSSGKDALAAGQVEIPIQARIQDLLLSLTDGWKTVTRRSLFDIFNGTDSSLATLKNTISAGKLLETPPIDKDKIQFSVMRLLYGFLVPVAWQAQDINPVVIDTGMKCGEFGLANYEWISPSSALASSTCVDNKLYNMLSAQGDAQDCPRGKDRECTKHELVPPPGLESLGSYMLSLEVIVDGAVRTQRALGSKKDSNYPELNKDTLDTIYKGLDIGTDANILKIPAGFISIPVCSLDEATLNWYKETVLRESGFDYANYPCNKPA